MKSKSRTSVANIRVDDETEQELVVAANKYGMTKASLIQYLILRFLDAQKKKPLAFPLEFKTMEDVVKESGKK
jgi:antitoxin component of RelBE/YafQ-DinJ toxin-antitoxin module